MLFAASLAAEPTLLWQRTFAPVTFGDQSGPNRDTNFAGGRGSANLAVRGDRVALIACDLPTPQESYYLAVLDGTSGSTTQCLRIVSDIGNSRAYDWPCFQVSASGDNVPGLVRLRWDADTGIIFTCQGAYASCASAWLPQPGADGMAQPAYAALPAQTRDARGRTRADLVTAAGTSFRADGLLPWAWGLAGMYTGGDAKRKYCKDWEALYGIQGSSYYNTPGYFAIGGDLIGVAKGAGWGHNQAGHLYLFHKRTGMAALAAAPPRVANQGGIELRPFHVGGLLLSADRVFCIGPGEDRDGDKALGAQRPEGRIPKVDQGIALWSYRVRWEDRQPGVPAETAVLETDWAYDLPSPWTAVAAADLDSHGQSFYETDGFYRPKPVVIDGDALWYAWKPDQAGGMELLRADAQGLRRLAVPIGKGRKGVELWPRLIAGPQGRMALCTGTARWRPRIQPADPDPLLAPFTYGRERKPWAELSEGERAKLRDSARKGGIWSPEEQPPRGGYEVACIADGQVQWTLDLSQTCPDLPANESWGYLDRVQAVVIGSELWVGWVDAATDPARLRLAVLDLGSRTAPIPRLHDIALDWPGSAARGSALTDLVAVDGRLYGLITRGTAFGLRDPRWQAQQVLALRP